LGDVDGIAGVSIMPDGRPGLIIDVNGLIKLATT
jgi:chemotaxis protein histidine kinase CheA